MTFSQRTCAAALLMASTLAANVTISNTRLRRTRLGSVVGAQDGNLANAKHDGQFVLVGMSYGDCVYTACSNETLGACGFGPGRILVWTSATLADGTWSEPWEILPASDRPSNSIYFRPHAVFNPSSKKWVLWVRYETVRGPHLSDDPTGYLSAVADSLEGPFVVAHANVTMHFANSADDNLFVDDTDGRGYIVHTARGTGMKVVVERLSPDFTYSLGATSAAERSDLIGPGGTEAPALFRRGTSYFVTMAKDCCYCAEGSATMVFVSQTGPLGPYAPAGSLGNAPGAQQNFVLSGPILGHDQVLWSGNRWGSDPVNHPPRFDNSLQYWTLLEFASANESRSGGSSGSISAVAPIKEIRWQDAVVLQVG